MAEGTVENLNIQISADAKKAEKALNSFVGTMNKVNSAFSKMNSGGIRKFSKEIGTLTSSLKSLNSIKISTPQISGLSSELRKLSNVNFSKVTESINPLKELSSALRSFEGLGSINIPEINTKNLSSVAKISQKFSSFDSSNMLKVAEGLHKISESMSLLSSLNLNDNGLNKVVNSLNRLFKADFGKFNPSDFKSIAQSIGSLGQIPDISTSINRFVSSLARLSNAGSKISVVASTLPVLSSALKKTINEISKTSGISESVNLFIQSIAKLSSAGNKTTQTASGLSTLADETIKFFQAMQKAPKISENTVRMTQALAQLASSGGKVGTATNTVSNAFNKLSQIGTKTTSVLKKVASGISSAFKQIGNSSSNIKTAQFSLMSLLKTVVAFRVGYSLLNFGKQAFELGSDITEVENVVNVAFAGMADKAYEFASTAKEQFGLSELVALKYAGTMKSVLNSSGVANEAAAEMSTTLAGLAGDLASFYNISQDDAWSKIMSGMAGEIEPLRRLGINMSVANLEAYALSQGITKSWQSMTQAEQVMLRYNYLMQATSAQQGDFARTSMTWANQLRILTLNIQQLASTIGQGLIAAILPALQALNVLMAALQKAAVVFRDFMYVLTGYEPPQGSGGFENEFAGVGDVASGLEDVSSAGDDAADSAEKLKKALSVLPFDELNQLSSNAEDLGSLGGAGGGIGDLGGAGIDTGSIVDAFGKSELPQAVNEWAERIRDAFLDHDWDRLGKEIADGINKGFKKIYDVINWRKVGPKITKFTKAFTETFNSLVDNIDWDLMGRTVGAGLNTVINTFNQIIGNINFKNLGAKISNGLRGAIEEINWVNLGNLLGNYFMISWNMLSGFISDMSKKNGAGLTGWEELGISIGDAIDGVFQKINFQTIGETLADGFNGVFQTLKNLTMSIDWEVLSYNIYTGINNMINGIDWAEAGKSLSKFVTDLLGTFARVAEETDWEGLGRGIGQFLSNIDWLAILKSVADIIVTTFGGIFEGLETSGTAGKIAAFLGKAFIAVKIVDILGIKTLVSKIVSSIASSIIEKSNINKISSAFSGLFEMGTQGVSETVLNKSGILNWINKIGSSALFTGGMIGQLSESIQNTEKMANGVDFTTLSLALGYLKENGDITSQTFDNLFMKISGAGASGENFYEFTRTIIQSLEESGTSVNEFKQAFEKALDEMGYSASEKSQIIGEAIGTGMDEGLKSTGESAEKTTNSWISKIISLAKEKLQIGSPSKVFFGIGEDTIQGYINGTKNKEGDAITRLSNLAKESVASFDGTDIKFENIGSGLMSGMKQGLSLNAVIVTMQILSLITSMLDAFSGVESKFSGIGKSIVSGLNVGIISSIGVLTTAISQIASVANSLSSSLYQSGKSAAQSFANGFKSVHIPTPHIGVSRYNRYYVGDSSFSIPSFKVNWYKTGGLFTGASIAGIGEDGNEAVLPLENKRTMRMIADSIVGSSGGMINEQLLTNAVAKGVAMAMMNNNQNQAPITVYAELKTENDEVLARAVTRGQQKIDYRMNPTPKFSF